MTDISRNALCPCGSGKKYKNCCLGRHGEQTAGRSVLGSAVRVAMDWLLLHHSDEVERIVARGFYGTLEDEELERLDEVPDHVQEMIDANIADWVVADARRWQAGRRGPMPPRVLDLVLGPDGAPLTREQCAWLTELGARPLRLYEVLEARPGDGLVLQDPLDPDSGSLRVRERSASKSLARWDVIGTRLLNEGETRVLAGCIYYFSPGVGHRLAEELKEEARRSRRRKPREGAEARAREDMTMAIIDAWLADLATPREIPTIVDAGTGEPMVLVTDHYQVLDWDGLARALESQPDVEGDRRDGWSRLESQGDGPQRVLLAVNLGKKPDRIECFARTLRRADEGRAWLESIAGASVRFLVRDMVEPRTLLKQMEREAPAPCSEPPALDMSPAEQTEVMQRAHEHIYRDWADKPIPALGDRSPREAVRSAKGRAAVTALLKQYEAGEARRARDEGRAPVDYAFLWASVGLARPGTM